jgi:hypothetical protein
MDPASVKDAMQRLEPDGYRHIACTCPLSGIQEAILLVGNQLAAQLAVAMAGADDVGDAKILVGLYSAELCECDVATLTSLPEREVVERLRKLTKAGTLSHRMLQGMNYFSLESQESRRIIGAVLQRD